MRRLTRLVKPVVEEVVVATATVAIPATDSQKLMSYKDAMFFNEQRRRQSPNDFDMGPDMLKPKPEPKP